MEPKMIGKTKSAGYQIGVRRTMQISNEEAWERITSLEGLANWLGVMTSIDLNPGHNYATSDGASGQIRVVKPLQQLRLTWQKKTWLKPSTVQIRIIPAAEGKNTISFHQENLKDQFVREEMKAHWEKALEKISKSLHTS